ncbi:MAG TPA: serine hydrolase [Ferruginibacter sp.]|nr:serine hydrolase [Ferruginibacter sp.]
MKKTILMLAFCATLFHAADAQQANSLAAEFDKVLNGQFPLNGTGGAVLVGRSGKIIYKKAFGMANLEHNVPMQTNTVFRVGSITKQFTAIAILQLMEQGKLNLQDEIIRFIPAYPMQGEKITIEHLLPHTSGIRDYTSIKDSVQRSKIDLTPAEMISYFQNQPMRFAPGTRYEYSNSNYFLLGFIIEKLTGKTYGQYLEASFFKPQGMTGSSYANDAGIIKNRAAGYTKGEKEIEHAAQISMTQPFAAGSILSTVEDLFKWQKAVQTYKLVKKESLEKAFTKYKLVNGKEINYGYGWRFGFIQESPSIWHGGLIDGFMTMAMYLPKEDVYVVVLSNCDCNSPERVTSKLAALAIGKPYADKEISVTNSVLQTYAGVYENENGDQRIISVAEGKLYSQVGRNQKTIAKAFKKDNFFFEDPMVTMEFAGNKTAIIDRLIIHSRSANEVWNKSDKALITQAEIKPDEKTLAMYTGEYEVSAQFGFTISKEKDRLYLQATGQEKLEMFAESNNKFFLKVNDAQFEFVNESGKITKVILKQGGRTTDAMKVK